MFFGWAIFGMVVVFLILLTIIGLVLMELPGFMKYLRFLKNSRGRPANH
jgi:predicted lipid-binding transport protein (Tim44 family)